MINCTWVILAVPSNGEDISTIPHNFSGLSCKDESHIHHESTPMMQAGSHNLGVHI